jgi:hypothetical protein
VGAMKMCLSGVDLVKSALDEFRVHTAWFD